MQYSLEAVKDMMKRAIDFMKTDEGRKAINYFSIRLWEDETDPFGLLRVATNISDRKARLIACMIARQRWYSMTKEGQDCVSIGERYLDHTGTDITSRELKHHISACLRRIKETQELPVSEENIQENRANRLSLKCCIVNIGTTFLQKTIERARKCNIEDSLICEIIRDIVGNPFLTDIEHTTIFTNGIVPDTRIMMDAARNIYFNIKDNGQVDSSELFMMAGYLQDNGCENHQILSNLTKECSYCKDLGSYQGITSWEIGGIYDRGAYDEETKNVHRHACVCKGTRLARHWKGNWVLDFLMGKI